MEIVLRDRRDDNPTHPFPQIWATIALDQSYFEKLKGKICASIRCDLKAISMNLTGHIVP